MSSTDFGKTGFDISKMSYDVTGTLVNSGQTTVPNENYPVGNLADPGNVPFDFGDKTPDDILAQRQADYDAAEAERKAADEKIIQVDPTKSDASATNVTENAALVPLDDNLGGDDAGVSATDAY